MQMEAEPAQAVTAMWESLPCHAASEGHECACAKLQCRQGGLVTCKLGLQQIACMQNLPLIKTPTSMYVQMRWDDDVNVMGI